VIMLGNLISQIHSLLTLGSFFNSCPRNRFSLQQVFPAGSDSADPLSFANYCCKTFS